MESEDELEASNEVLRLKLELEHGMNMDGNEGLSLQAENQWLQYIYDFEKQCQNASRIKVFDFIGRPSIALAKDLSESDITEALKGLEALLQEKGIVLDCCCEYDAATIYRFITEELFQHEIDGITIEGMVHHFIYEEFHPNHDYDIRKLVTDFVGNLLGKKWDEQFDGMALATVVSFKGKNYDTSNMSSFIVIFQETHLSCTLENFSIEEVSAEFKMGCGVVKALLAYAIRPLNGEPQKVEGECLFQVLFENGCWNISMIKIPGFGD